MTADNALTAEIARYTSLTPQERRADDHQRYLAADARYAAMPRGETGRVLDWPTGRLEGLGY